ncbi:MAG TPA: ATP-binding protein [Rhizobacter sp.]|nr:ATP-binding protein [Rhizobacter sp.]
MRVKGSLQRQLTWVVMTTTLAALLLSAFVLMVYEVRAYRQAWILDLSTQADLIATATAPALAFDDPKAANENLALLRVRPQIRAAAIYTANGRLFAGYVSALSANDPLVPATALAIGHRFNGADLEVSQPILQDGDLIGSAYIRAAYGLTDRLKDYLLILAIVTLASLAAAWLIFRRLQKGVTRPILAVAQAARDVVERRNYAVRVPKTTTHEVSVLVESFNDMVRDLSSEMIERRKAEEALRTADRHKDEFLATLAHELRNPLAPMTNGLAILKLPQAGEAAHRRVRDIMERQLKQMARLIDDLLDVSRISTGKMDLRREHMDLMPVLRGAVEIVEPDMQARGHTLAVSLPPMPVWIDGDAARLAQVFVNLLNNAAKYTENGGRIALHAELIDAQVWVRVSDDGLGIEPAKQAAVFEMFEQVDKSLERGRAGLGIGLTLARQLVDLHDGSLGVHSAGLGQGSEFTVCLPAAMQSDAPAVSGPPPPGGVQRPMHILIADDNVDFAATLAEMLTELGHRVRVSHDGQAAYDAVLAELPDVGLFDIGMPRLNGYELAQRLRQREASRSLVMVALTGWGQDADRRRALDAGFDEHVVKPVQPLELLQMLVRLSAHRRPKAGRRQEMRVTPSSGQA